MKRYFKLFLGLKNKFPFLWYVCMRRHTIRVAHDCIEDKLRDCIQDGWKG